MREVPIPFTASMIRANYAGLKNNTRRGMASKYPGLNWDAAYVDPGPSPVGNPGPYLKIPAEDGTVQRIYPKYQVGDRLWVREAWRTDAGYDLLPPRDVPRDALIEYLADTPTGLHGKYRYARFMPRWMSRATLIVIDVKIERLQEISAEDAIAEGVETLFSEQECRTVPGLIGTKPRDHGYKNYLWHGSRAKPSSTSKWPYQFSNYGGPRGSFSSLWESINGPGSWEANPWVTAYAYTFHPVNIDRLEA